MKSNAASTGSPLNEMIGKIIILTFSSQPFFVALAVNNFARGHFIDIELFLG